MKKILLSLTLAGVLGLGMANAATIERCNCNKNTDKNKITHNKAVRKTGKGISHGYYDLTHNKVTKVLHINKGNRKYSNQNDINM